MSGETSEPNPINTESLHSVVETSGQVPSSAEVLDSFPVKIATLQQKVAQLESQPRVTLNATEMMQKRRDVASAKADLAQVETLWDHLGGKDIEAAAELKQELNFKADADDHLVADANIREAKDAFYENFLKEYSKESTSDSNGNKTGVKNIVVKETTENDQSSVAVNRSDRETQGFNLDAEVAAAEAQSTSEAHPTETTKFPTHEEVLERLRETDKWKNAPEQERQIYEEEASNAWVVANAEREKDEDTSNVTEAVDKKSPEEPSLSDTEDRFPTRDEVIAKLKESDRWKNASREERQLLEDATDNEYIAAATAKIEKDLGEGSKDSEEKEERSESEDGKKTDAILERYKGLMDGLSDKEREVVRKALLAAMADGTIDNKELPEPGGEDDAAKRAETEKNAHIEAETKRIVEELDKGELGAKYKEALDKYAEAKADYDTKGRIGRRRREELLLETEKALMGAKLEYAKSLAAKKREAGLYEGEENIIGAAMANDIFNEIRKLDPESRASTEAVRESRIENRNVLQKAAASIGKFLNWGNKIGRTAKNVASGGIVGFGLMAAGAGFPVTTAVAVGASFLARASAATYYLDENLRSGAYKKALLDDEHFKRFIESTSAQQGTAATDLSMNTLASDILGEARKVGMEQSKQARKRAALRAGEIGLGFAIGGFAGNMVHNAFYSGGNVAASGSSTTNPSGVTAHPNEGTLPNDRYPNIEHPKEVIKGLKAHIHHSEGGGEFVEKFLRANGIHLSGSESIQAWDKATHGARAIDIFVQNGDKLDTYAMTGKFGGHAGLAYPGNVTIDSDFAHHLLEIGRSMAGK